MNTLRIAILPAVALGLLTGLASAQDKPHKPEGTTSAPPPAMKSAPAASARGSQLVDLDVLDSAGKKLGEVKDLLAQDSGDLTAVIERDGGGLACVPLSALAPKTRAQEPAKDAEKGAATADVESFTYTGDATRLASAEVIADPAAVDAAALERCRAHFAKSAGSEPASKPAEPKDKSAAVATGGKPVCVKKLLGTDVKDSLGEDIGDVKDVAVDLGRGQLAYVVVSTGGVMGMGDKLHGIAMSRLVRASDGKSVSLPLSKDALKALKGFDIDHLPTSPDLSVSATGDLAKPATDANS